MANMEIQGKIIKIGPVQTVGQNGFQRRDVVIMTEDQYPQYIPFDFVQEKCSLLDNFHEGQVVLISFNVRGREWVNPQGETKYIVNLQGWRIQDAMAAAQAAPQGYGQPAYPPQGYAQPQYQQAPPQYQQAPAQPFQSMPQGQPLGQPQQSFQVPPQATTPPAAAPIEEEDLPCKANTMIQKQRLPLMESLFY